MKAWPLILLTIVFFLPLRSVGLLYKWVDSEGNVHYGDKLPAEQAGKQHDELNPLGVRINKVERAATREELDARNRALKEEQERREKERRARAEQARKGKILLDTFTTERDIVLMRDDRLDSIDSTIRITKTYNQQIDKQIFEVQERIDAIKKNQGAVPQNLTDKLESWLIQRKKNEIFIAGKFKERARVEQQFSEDLSLFRELKGLDNPVDAGVAEEGKEGFIIDDILHP